jgi:hypothetical protein
MGEFANLKSLKCGDLKKWHFDQLNDRNVEME